MVSFPSLGTIWFVENRVEGIVGWLKDGMNQVERGKPYWTKSVTSGKWKNYWIRLFFDDLVFQKPCGGRKSVQGRERSSGDCSGSHQVQSIPFQEENVRCILDPLVE